MLRYAVTILIATAGLAGAALADPPPVPESKAAALGSLQTKLESEKEREQSLKKERDDAAKELEKRRKALVEIADSVRANEQLLQSLEQRMQALSGEQAEITARLEKDYGAMADLILALERMRRIPPEALIVRPGAPLQTAQTAALLQTILPDIHKRAAMLSEDLNRLSAIQRKLDSDRSQTLETKAALDAKYKDLETSVTERDRLYKQLNKDYKSAAAAVERISKEAGSLQDFIKRLEQEEQNRQIAAVPLPKPGSPRLPVAGFIRTGFGEKDNIGAESQGLSIEAQPSAMVVAPMGGIVRYAGPFKHYGNMVIIEHDNGYHSLVAGLQKINTTVGQKQAAGEPIGNLPASSSRGGNPALYYELRYKGQPVDPSTKFSNLKS